MRHPVASLLMTSRRPSSQTSASPQRAGDPRLQAVRLLVELQRDRQTLDALMERLEARERLRDSRDRDLLNAIVFGVLRWRGRLDYLIARFSKTPLAKIDPFILNILRMGLFQIVFLTRIPPSAAVHTAVELTKSRFAPWVASFVNAVLRKAAAGHAAVAFPDPRKEPVKALAAIWGFPEWLVERWLRRYGADPTALLCESINAIPPLALRTNTLKACRRDVVAALAAEADAVQNGDMAPDGILVRGLRRRLTELPAFRQGWFQVQDEAAQLVSLLLAPRPGETVLDACAGRGGKTGHLAQLMANQGVLAAMDHNAARLEQLKEELRRLGVSNVSVLEADLARPPPQRPEARFDRVLLDAPCSGLGTLRRNPDIKWAAGKKDLQRYHSLQLTLLERAAERVKPGGVLVYAVCSPEPEESIDVVRTFLDRNPGFLPDGDTSDLPQPIRELIDPQGFLQTYPHLRYMDGFFAARMRRT
jgi:16S rRNA (cytosine967-C5)-methyltransferase